MMKTKDHPSRDIIVQIKLNLQFQRDLIDDEQTCGCFSLSEDETHRARSNRMNLMNRRSTMRKLEFCDFRSCFLIYGYSAFGFGSDAGFDRVVCLRGKR